MGPSQTESCPSPPSHRWASQGPPVRRSLTPSCLVQPPPPHHAAADAIPGPEDSDLVPSLTLAAALVLLFLLFSAWLVWDRALRGFC